MQVCFAPWQADRKAGENDDHANERNPMKSLPKNLGELKRSGYKPRRVREEIRENLINALKLKSPLFPGIIGYDDTVVPQMLHALLAQHNVLLLGQRGQAK